MDIDWRLGIGRDFGRATQVWFKQPKLIRDLRGLDPVLARSGTLEARLATTKKEIHRAQRLRFQTFCIEGGAVSSRRNALARRDKCSFDKFCDHLLVIDTDSLSFQGEPRERVVGTYRLLRSDVARVSGGFYSRTEFALDSLLERHPDKRFLELGRSCVHAEYRSKRVIDLLWRSIGVYAQHHRIDVLIGCASLPGTDQKALAEPLSYLFHHAAADAPWHVRPIMGRSVPMNRLDKEQFDPRRVLAGLPPLIKAYARAGSRFSTEAVIDRQFNTTDVFTVLPFVEADRRYLAHFGSPGLGTTH